MPKKAQAPILSRDRNFVPPITVARLRELLSEYPDNCFIMIDTRHETRPWFMGGISFEFRGDRPQLVILRPNNRSVDPANKGAEITNG